MNDKLILTGKIINTHGVRGEVKIESWADTPEFLAKFKKIYIDDAEVKVIRSRVHKNAVIAQLDGIDTMDAAELLKGKEVKISRDDVNLPKGKYFISDLIGLTAISDDGTELGTVNDIFDIPSGSIAEIKGEREILVPIRPEFVLEHNDKTVTVHLIEGM